MSLAVFTAMATLNASVANVSRRDPRIAAWLMWVSRS